MIRKPRKPLKLVSASACSFLDVVLGLPQAGHAQLFDHLRCYKVRDTTRVFSADSYAMDLVSDEPALFADQGCEMKVKAKFLCTDVDKQNVVPAPPGAPAGAQPGDFLCYKFKGQCTPKVPAGTTLDVEDQFGAGTLGLLGPGMICAPVNVIPPPTTTTTTTTLAPPPGCNASAPPTCGGTCPPSETCLDIGGFCFCFPDDQVACAEDAPACGAACPVGNVCVPGFGTACFCVPTAWETCGDSAPTCDGACPVGFECNPGAVVCQCDPL